MCREVGEAPIGNVVDVFHVIFFLLKRVAPLSRTGPVYSSRHGFVSYKRPFVLRPRGWPKLTVRFNINAQHVRDSDETRVGSLLYESFFNPHLRIDLAFDAKANLRKNN